MNPSATDSRIDALLDEALALPLGKRDEFLLQVCGTDAALHQRLQRLLAFADCDGFLDQPPRLAATMTAPQADAPPRQAPPEPAEDGQRIGAYRLVRKLGAGGMGEVWLGERVEGGFRQQVAIKLMRHDVGTSIARFDAERAILAGLEHPGIARLYDGGLSALGQPYMAMEYVDGEELLDWCRNHRSGLRERLQLFIEICEAVAYAHRQLVIHRDLKPANVLVTQDGRVKLLDFGVARLLQHDTTDHSTRTAHLSPAYAAPEQLMGGNIGMAADVHALGATLHQLLTGKLPWAVQDLPLGAAVQRLLQQAPEPPSRSADAQSPVAARALRGDLDAIVAKALRREPEARYPDARALAEDVRRHLRNEPVAARSGARAYVARRFVRRHWVALAGTALLVLAIGAAAVYAILARQRAEAALQRVEAVRAFVIDLFESSNPTAGNGRDLSARALVDIGARRLEAGLATDPDTRIELLGVVGHLYGSLGEFARGNEFQSTRLKEARARYAPDDPRVLHAALAMVQAHTDNEQFDEADALLQDVLQRAPEGDAASATLRAQALDRGSALEFYRGRYDQALRYAEQALALKQRLPGTKPPDLADTLMALGEALYTAGRIAEAEKPLRDALALLRGHEREESALLWGARTDLSRVLTSLGRLDEAAVLVDANIADITAVHGEDHPRLADEIYQTGSIARLRNDWPAAIAAYRRALPLYERSFGSGHSFVATTLTSLSQALSRTGEYDEAIETLKRAHEIYLKTLGPLHTHTGVSQIALGDARYQAGDLAGAERDYRTALATFAQIGDGRHIFAEAANLALGRTLLKQNRVAEAEAPLRQSRERLAAEFGPTDYRVVNAGSLLVQCLARTGRRDAARTLLQEIEQSVAAASGDMQRQNKHLSDARALLEGAAAQRER